MGEGRGKVVEQLENCLKMNYFQLFLKKFATEREFWIEICNQWVLKKGVKWRIYPVSFTALSLINSETFTVLRTLVIFRCLFSKIG